MNVTRPAFLIACILAAGCGGRIEEGPATEESATPAATSDPLPVDAGATSPSPVTNDPFHPGDDWVGTYTCAQGLTELDVRIMSAHGNAIDDAIFLFDWTGGDVQGSYHMTGVFDPATSSATFTPSGWIDDPGAAGGYDRWYMVGMQGTVTGTTYAGTIPFDGCGSFTIAKQ